MKGYNKYVIYLPFAFAMVLAIGLYFGSRIQFQSKISSLSGSISNNVHPIQHNKINAVLDYIQSEYVDSVSESKLTDQTIQSLLQELDPHSYYITAEEYAAMNEPLMGDFEGIGIEFSIQKDTIVVIAPIAGGPSEILGIQSGDRIVYIDSELVAGIGITNKDVMNKLRGQRGTKVNVKVLRHGLPKLIPIEITRDKIPIYSVDAAYMLTKTCGYIKISRFSKNTIDELKVAGRKLIESGLTELILDLRGNGGGFLDAAVQVADEFITGGKLIVYTKGRARKKEMYYAAAGGMFEKSNLVVLVDEGSASASEIVAGAIQDNDRGLIIGRRTFGKGLVQEQTPLWPDGSSIRLTVARYYTPTGRCIQKPYKKGSKTYYNDYYKQLNNGEFLTIDSLSIPDSEKYKTAAGKTVYGGGGIMPDIIIPYDSLHNTYYFAEIVYRGILQQFAFNYSDKNRNMLNKYSSFEEFKNSFFINRGLLNEFIIYADKEGVEKKENEIERSLPLIKNRLKAYIARNIWQNDGFYPLINEIDPAIKVAKRSLSGLKQ